MLNEKKEYELYTLTPERKDDIDCYAKVLKSDALLPKLSGIRRAMTVIARNALYGDGNGYPDKKRAADALHELEKWCRCPSDEVSRVIEAIDKINDSAEDKAKAAARARELYDRLDKERLQEMVQNYNVLAEAEKSAECDDIILSVLSEFTGNVITSEKIAGKINEKNPAAAVTEEDISEIVSRLIDDGRLTGWVGYRDKNGDRCLKKSSRYMSGYNYDELSKAVQHPAEKNKPGWLYSYIDATVKKKVIKMNDGRSAVFRLRNGYLYSFKRLNIYSPDNDSNSISYEQILAEAFDAGRLDNYYLQAENGWENSVVISMNNKSAGDGKRFRPLNDEWKDCFLKIVSAYLMSLRYGAAENKWAVINKSEIGNWFTGDSGVNKVGECLQRMMYSDKNTQFFEKETINGNTVKIRINPEIPRLFSVKTEDEIRESLRSDKDYLSTKTVYEDSCYTELNDSYEDRTITLINPVNAFSSEGTEPDYDLICSTISDNASSSFHKVPDKKSSSKIMDVSLVNKVPAFRMEYKDAELKFTIEKINCFASYPGLKITLVTPQEPDDGSDKDKSDKDKNVFAEFRKLFYPFVSTTFRIADPSVFAGEA